MCIDCGKVFAEDENYQIHMETHVKPVDKKEVDGAKEIVTEQVVADQPFVSAMPVGHICTICSFLAEDSTDLNDHTLKYHLQGINCPECDYRCNLQEEMRHHRAEKHNLKCVLCGFTALNSLVLNEHTKTSHNFM